MRFPEQARILRRIVRRANGKTAMAKTHRRSRQFLDRALKGQVGLGAELCVELAIVHGEDHLALLRAAGHHKLATLLERVGTVRTDLSSEDRALLADLGALPAHQQQAVRALIRSMLE